MEEVYEKLAVAIVMQAVRDWRSSVRKLNKRPIYDPAREMRDECERFFRSGWFMALTGANGSYILLKLKKEEGIYDE